MYCKYCGCKIDSNSQFCFNCGTKNEIQNFQSNNVNSSGKNKLTNILGISVGILFVIAIVVLISGIFLCSPDPVTGENISGLSFDMFGTILGIIFIINFILIIFIVLLNIIKQKK